MIDFSEVTQNLTRFCFNMYDFLFQCIVQSYLQWLQDSDYNSICELCNKDLNTEDSIRLTCYRKILHEIL